MEAIEQVLANAEQGDSAAFRQLYDYSYETVYGECIKNLHNPLDAEDVTQDSYLTIYRRLKDVKDPQKFLGWCRRIAHNASVDYIRKHQRKAGKDDYKPPVSDETFEGMDQVAGEDTDLLPEEQAEQNMIHELLQTAMDDIAPQRATCLALYQQGTPYKEIAQMLSLPVGTVKSNVYYAKKALRKKIEEIEHKEHVQIHGFTLIPVAGGGVQVQMENSAAQTFIQADTRGTSSAMQEEIWNKVRKKAFPAHHLTNTLWIKVVAIAAATVIVVGGITLAVHESRKSTVSTATNTTVVTVTDTAGDQQQAGVQQQQTRNQVAQPREASQRDRQQSQRARQQETAAVRENTTARQTEPPTTERTTREIFTF